jgi:hypothetical protein
MPSRRKTEEQADGIAKPDPEIRHIFARRGGGRVDHGRL